MTIPQRLLDSMDAGNAVNVSALLGNCSESFRSMGQLYGEVEGNIGRFHWVSARELSFTRLVAFTDPSMGARFDVDNGPDRGAR